jgi:uncharacterized protein YuzE
MKISYFQETDTLYFELDESTTVESNEVSPGVVFDFDQNNKIVGIEIEKASNLVNLKSLPISKSNP